VEVGICRKFYSSIERFISTLVGRNRERRSSEAALSEEEGGGGDGRCELRRQVEVAFASSPFKSTIFLSQGSKFLGRSFIPGP